MFDVKKLIKNYLIIFSIIMVLGLTYHANKKKTVAADAPSPEKTLATPTTP